MVNPSIFEQGAYLSTNVLYLYSIYVFLNKTFITKRPRTKTLFPILLVIYYICISFVFIKINFLVVTICVNVFFIFLLSLLYSSRSKWNYIVMTVFVYLLGFIAEMLTTYGFSFAMKINMNTLLDQNSLQISMMLVSKIILFFLAQAIPTLLMRSQKTSSLTDYPISYWLAIVALPLCSVSGIYGIYMLSLSSPQHTNPYLLLAIVMIAAIDGLIFFLYDRLLSAKRNELNNIALEKEVRYYYNQFELVYDAQKQAEMLRHDIKNKLTGLQGYMSAQSDEAKAYFQDMVDETISTDIPACCGIPVIDAIVNSKAAEARKKAIQFDAILNLDESCFQVPPMQMSTILGNALDNAIEATQKVESNKRYIKIGITDSTQTLLIVIKNSFNGLINTDTKKHLISLKGEKSGHGLGLQSIRRVVNQLDGELTTRYDSNEFTLSILLYTLEL